MTREELKDRTQRFALLVINLVSELSMSQAAKVISYQLVKAATSVGANYRAACRARSGAEYQSKLQTVLEESDESSFWLEVIAKAKLLPHEKVTPIYQEADELTAIFNHALYKFRNK